MTWLTAVNLDLMPGSLGIEAESASLWLQDVHIWS